MNLLTRLFICCTIFPFFLWGQSKDILSVVELDSTGLLIGDQVYGRVILNAPEGQTIIFPNVSALWKNDKYEIIHLSDQRVENSTGAILITKQEFAISFWDTGTYQLPALPFAYTKGDKADTVWAQVPEIRVDFPAGITGDSTFMAPIKTIMMESRTFMDYFYMVLPFILLFVGLLVVAFLIYVFMRWQKARNERLAQLSPEEESLKQLEELLALDYTAEKKYAEFHTEISLIIRNYLYRRFDIRALESVTSQLIPMVTYEHLEKSLIEDLKEVLDTADLVKFAKASPLDRANTFAVEYIRRMISYVLAKIEEEEFLNAEKQ